jgi:hypothetical protein
LAERAIFEALAYAAMIGRSVSRAPWRSLQASVDACRRLSDGRVTDALAAIASELPVVLADAMVTMEQRHRLHALLSG